MGAKYLNNLTGILNDALLDNSATYIQNWLLELKNNTQLVVEAVGKAQQAVDYILNKDLF
jgi:antirestriction protein ArdC